MRATILLIGCLVAACGGSGGGGPTGPAGNNNNPPGSAPQSASVSIRTEADGYGYTSGTFDPGSVTVARGGSVTWTNASGVQHNVTFGGATGAPADISAITNGSMARTFSTAGTFNYSCTNHVGMSGNVVVQ